LWPEAAENDVRSDVGYDAVNPLRISLFLQAQKRRQPQREAGGGLRLCYLTAILQLTLPLWSSRFSPPWQ
jgi:hypothetical protein